jgi:hypothetical protein
VSKGEFNQDACSYEGGFKRKAQQVNRFHDAVTSLNIGLISETIRFVLKLMSVFL